MTFKVDLSEVNTLASKIETTSHVLENDLHNVMQQLDELITLDSFQGETASHAKKYFENVHQTAIQSIQFIAHELATNMKTHIETFKQDVDSNDHARIEYAYLQEIKENVQSSHTQVEDSVQSISQSLESISDIIDVEPPQMTDLETSKSNLDHTIDQLCNDVELFTAKGSEHDEEMKEMLHQVETLMTEAQSQNGETRFTITETSSMNQSLSFLTEANLILESRQADRRKENVAETQHESFSKLSEAMEISTKQATYAKKPNSIVELSQVIIDVVKGTASAVYHLGEDFVLGIVQIVEDLPGTLEALGNMISRPIETAKYIGKAIYDSFIRDVIHGDAESRAHWFTYAIGSVFGFKGLDKAGKAGVQAAKQGAQKAGQKLDELLPYHPKHQLAMDGPVPYNVYDGVNLRDQLMVKVENVSRKNKNLRSGDKISGKGTGELNKDLAKAYLRDIETKTGRKVNKEQIHLIKESLRNKNYGKLTPKETAKHRSKFTSSLKDKLIAEWEEKTNQKWPRYTEEVLDKNGEVARSIGQPYDAHHIIENNFGGPHEWWNIHPAKYPNEHQAGIHGKGAPSGKLFPRR